MNTTEIDGKQYTLTEGEGGKLTLTPLIKQPAKRTPEAGDVWQSKRGNHCTWLLGSKWHCIDLEDGEQCGISKSVIYADFTYLGKFSEVYVKRDDVREALSIGNSVGHCFLAPGHVVTPRPHYIRSREALAKLGITAK